MIFDDGIEKLLYDNWINNPDYHSFDGKLSTRIYKCDGACQKCPFDDRNNHLKFSCIDGESKLYEWMKDNHLHPEIFI